jgi:hypothetical protein
MKKAKFWFIPLLIFFALGCEKMEDNYEQYITNKIYSPKVIDLTASIGYKTALLEWINPTGDMAKKIEIVFDDVLINSDELISSYQLTDLELKGYQVFVYTIDLYGNRSVPAQVYIFPSGEEE